jgi:hypothetical protein
VTKQPSAGEVLDLQTALRPEPARLSISEPRKYRAVVGEALRSRLEDISAPL